MESDPTTALSAAIGHNRRATLPPQIQGELETQVSGTGDLLLVCAMPAQGTRGAGGVQRFVRLNGETYRTVVYGRRATQTTKFNIPLHGITLDDVFVLDENVLAEVSPEESSDPAEPIVNLSASVGPVANPGAAVLARMGGTLYRFGSAEHLRQSEALLEEFESGPAANLEEPASVSLQRSQSDDRSLRVAPRPQIQRASGVVDYKVLVIRTDFSDLIGDPHALGGGPPYMASSVQELADGQVALFYQQRSYGKTTLHFTVTPQLYRLPSTAVHYSSQYPPSDLYHDAVATASADYAVTNYDKVVVLFSYLGGPILG
jgi:hypothetical protein